LLKEVTGCIRRPTVERNSKGGRKEEIVRGEVVIGKQRGRKPKSATASEDNDNLFSSATRECSTAYLKTVDCKVMKCAWLLPGGGEVERSVIVTGSSRGADSPLTGG